MAGDPNATGSPPHALHRHRFGPPSAAGESHSVRRSGATPAARGSISARMDRSLSETFATPRGEVDLGALEQVRPEPHGLGGRGTPPNVVACPAACVGPSSRQRSARSAASSVSPSDSSAAPARREQRIVAAVMAAGPGAIASHRSAAHLWGIPRPDDDEIDVFAPGTRAVRRRWAALVLHRPRDRRGPDAGAAPEHPARRTCCACCATSPANDPLVVGPRRPWATSSPTGWRRRWRCGSAVQRPRPAGSPRRAGVPGRPRRVGARGLRCRQRARAGYAPAASPTTGCRRCVFHAVHLRLRGGLLGPRQARSCWSAMGGRPHGRYHGAVRGSTGPRGSALAAVGYVSVHFTYRQITCHPACPGGGASARCFRALGAATSWTGAARP